MTEVRCVRAAGWSVVAMAMLACVNGCASDRGGRHPATAPSTQPFVLAHLAGTYELAWHDEFDGPVLDATKWAYRTDSKMWSTQRPENVSVENGRLRIALRKEPFGGKQYTGGGVISRATFKFGYYEARMRVPPGAGWHTSFWMQRSDGSGGTGTALAEQEVDVIEQDSVKPTRYAHCLHAWQQRKQFPPVSVRVSTPDLSAGFHTFGCELTPGQARYFFDGVEVGVKDLAGRNLNEQNIWLTSIAASLGGTQAVDDAKLPAFAEFEYVRFFARRD